MQLINCLVFFLSTCVLIPIDTVFRELEPISVKQLSEAYEGRFDISGIVDTPTGTFVIADKSDNRFIYQIEWTESDRWEIVKEIPLAIKGPIDFEALDYADGFFFMTNEYDNEVYKINEDGSKIESLSIGFRKAEERVRKWKKNTGLEGLAIDTKRHLLYLAKERQPRFIAVADLESGEVQNKVNFPETESNDISDMKVDHGFLYVLERNGNYITKLNPDTWEVIEKVSYRNTCSNNEGKLYEPTNFGMAEALLLTEDEIWVALDNNELKASAFAEKQFGMKGDKPVIIRFKRPEGF
ncbi:esterase-like activity of phytase family protein [Limibacter armeniacum]|uniref:esterase-like activity of phytase family protein n=1 Tax=Limibacter armeniacum TaxID=466084 RepID=UPI002FE53425